MPIKATVQTRKLEQKLAQLTARLRDPSTANRAVSIALYGWVIRNYDSEGGLVGGWAPLTVETWMRKGISGHDRMLVESGAMRASILPFSDATDAGVGTPLTSADGAPYPLFHQEGTSLMPARPFLPDRDTALEMGLKVYEHFIAQEIRGAGL